MTPQNQLTATAKQFPCGACGAKLEYAPSASTLKCPLETVAMA
jgi:LSD1 subclass zinc finger protein